MPLLVRRINRARWDQTVIQNSDLTTKISSFIKTLFTSKIDVQADAITNCLKTFNNDLSVWRIENRTDLDNAILALITGNTVEKLSTLHIVLIEEKVAIRRGIELVNTPGDTVIKYLVNTHKDLTNLTYIKLGIVKDLIIDCIKENETNLYTRKQLKEIILKAINDGRLNKADLNPELVKNEKL